VPALADETRDSHIIRGLYDLGVATVYVPLLTEDEIRFDSRERRIFRYDADFLAQRFIDIAQWVKRSRGCTTPIGYIGSSGLAAVQSHVAASRPLRGHRVDRRTHRPRGRAPAQRARRRCSSSRHARPAHEPRGAGEDPRRPPPRDRHGDVESAVENVVEKAVHWLEDKLR
jgi:hypothetical protein